MKRREFISLIGAAAGWPLAAHAQQQAMPVIGYLNPSVPHIYADMLRAFRQGLKESGYVEGETVAIDYRWAENQPGRLAEQAADLARRRVNVIAATSAPAAVAATKATTTIPTVFIVPEDPVRLGLVTSLARPGGNATGINFFAAELAAKRLEFLRTLVPAAKRVAALLNPAEPTIFAANRRDVEAAASRHGSATAPARRQHHRRDRGRLRGAGQRSAGCPVHQQRPVLHQPRRAAGAPGDPARHPGGRLDAAPLSKSAG